MVLFALAGDMVQVNTKILVVEDDDSSRNALVQILGLHGYDVIASPSFTSALAQLRKKPSIILLDLMLPDGNGIDILRQIRAQHVPIRVAVITGADRPMISEAIELSPDALFTKPLNVNALIEWIETP